MAKVALHAIDDGLHDNINFATLNGLADLPNAITLIQVIAAMNFRDNSKHLIVAHGAMTSRALLLLWQARVVLLALT